MRMKWAEMAERKEPFLGPLNSWRLSFLGVFGIPDMGCDLALTQAEMSIGERETQSFGLAGWAENERSHKYKASFPLGTLLSAEAAQGTWKLR